MDNNQRGISAMTDVVSASNNSVLEPTSDQKRASLNKPAIKINDRISQRCQNKTKNINTERLFSITFFECFSARNYYSMSNVLAR